MKNGDRKELLLAVLCPAINQSCFKILPEGGVEGLIKKTKQKKPFPTVQMAVFVGVVQFLSCGNKKETKDRAQCRGSIAQPLTRLLNQ